MFEIKCDICGGKLTMQYGGSVAICDNCKMQCSIERIREKIQQNSVANSPEPSEEFMDIRDGVLVKYTGRAKSLVLPRSVTKIGEYAFCGGREGATNQYNNVDLQQISIPDTVEEIGSCAFVECTALRQVNLSDGLYAIHNGAFACCAELNSIILPNTLRYIGERAFSETGIDKITFPESIIFIGSHVLSHCNKLESIEVCNQNANIAISAFSHCESLKRAVLPESIKHNHRILFCTHDDYDESSRYDGFCSELHTIFVGNELIVPSPRYRELILGCLYGTGVHKRLCDVLEVYLNETRCPYCGSFLKKHFLSTYYCEDCKKDFGKVITSHYHAGFPHDKGYDYCQKIMNSPWYIELEQIGEI